MSFFVERLEILVMIPYHVQGTKQLFTGGCKTYER